MDTSLDEDQTRTQTTWRCWPESSNNTTSLCPLEEISYWLWTPSLTREKVLGAPPYSYSSNLLWNTFTGRPTTFMFLFIFSTDLTLKLAEESLVRAKLLTHTHTLRPRGCNKGKKKGRVDASCSCAETETADLRLHFSSFVPKIRTNVLKWSEVATASLALTNNKQLWLVILCH